MAVLVYPEDLELAASVTRTMKIFERAGFEIVPNPGTGPKWQPHGPAGFKFVLREAGKPDATSFGSVIVTQAEWDGDEWLHASTPAAWDQTPHVNVHPYALHLWGRADGRTVLPDFGKWGSI